MKFHKAAFLSLIILMAISSCTTKGGDSKTSSMFNESTNSEESMPSEPSSSLSLTSSLPSSTESSPVLSSLSSSDFSSIPASSESSISQINMDNVTDSYKETVRRFKNVTGVELPYFENIETYIPSYLSEDSPNLYFEVAGEKSSNEELFQAYLDFFTGLFDEWNEDSPYYNADFDLTRYTWTLVDYRVFSVEISESCLAIDTWIGNETDLKEHSSYVNARKQFKAYTNIELPTMYCVRADTSYIDAYDESSESYTVSLIGGSNLNGETYQNFEDLFISTIGECDQDYPKEETKLKTSKWSKFGMSIILKHCLDNHHITIEAIDDAKDQSKNSYIAGIMYFKEATGFVLPSDGDSSIGNYDIGGDSFNFDLPNKDKDSFDNYAKDLQDNNEGLEKSVKDDGSIEFKNKKNGNSVTLSYDESNSNINGKSAFNGSYASSFMFRLARFRIKTLFRIDIPNYSYACLSSFKEEKKYRFINFTSYPIDPIDEEYIPDDYLYRKLYQYMLTVKGYQTYGEDSGYDEVGNRIDFIKFFNYNNGANVTLKFNRGTKETMAKFAFDGDIITYNEEKGLEIMEKMHHISIYKYDGFAYFSYASVAMTTPYTHFVIKCIDGQWADVYDGIIYHFDDLYGDAICHKEVWVNPWYEWNTDNGVQIILETGDYLEIHIKVYNYTYEFYEYEYDAAADIEDMH